MNFSFLNSGILWAVPLALLPLLIHLIFRRPPKVISFGDLRFLRKVFEQYRPRKKLQEWLILLARIFSILFLLLFFSRPVLHWGSKSVAEDSVALVILLDRSYSMRYQESGVSRWERILQLAETTLGSLRDTDRSALVVFSDKVDFFSGYLTNQHLELIQTLNQMKPSYRNTNVLSALQVAYPLLSNSGASNKTILILSDMAKNGWKTGNQSKEGEWESLISNYDPSVKVLYSEIPQIKRNMTAENIQLFSDFYTGFMKVQVEVKNSGQESEQDSLVYLDYFKNESSDKTMPRVIRQSENTVSLEAGERKTVLLTVPNFEENILSGRLGLRADGLTADDSIFFVHPSPRKIRVLCLEEPSGIAALSGESYFLRQAMMIPPSPYEVTTVRLDEVKKIHLPAYDSVILVNSAEIDIDLAQILKSYVINGGSLFVTMGERAAIHKMQSLSDILPCTFLGVREIASQSLLFNADPEDAELLKFKTDYDLEKIRIDKIVQPVIKENAGSLILLSDGTPLLLFTGDNKVGVWVSTIDRDWNNLVSKPVFVPLLRVIIERMANNGNQNMVSRLFVGDLLEKRLLFSPAKDSVQLTSPSGESITVRVSQKDLISSALEEPGVYSLNLRSGAKEIVEKIAVNVDTRKGESNGTLVQPSEFKDFLTKTKWVSLKTDERYRTELIAALRGKELSRFLLAFSGLFLLSEMVLVRYRK